MKRTLGTILILFGILCIAATILWIVLELTHLPADATEDDKTSLMGAWIFAFVLIALEAAILLAGLYLRRPNPDRVEKRSNRRLLPVAIYYGFSAAIAVVAVLISSTNLKLLRPLALLTFQPTVLAQLICGGLLGIKVGNDAAWSAVLFVFSLLYFAALLYPLYRMLTMDRKAEPASFRRMMILLILLCGSHFLIILVVYVLSRA